MIKDARCEEMKNNPLKIIPEYFAKCWLGGKTLKNALKNIYVYKKSRGRLREILENGIVSSEDYIKAVEEIFLYGKAGRKVWLECLKQYIIAKLRHKRPEGIDCLERNKIGLEEDEKKQKNLQNALENYDEEKIESNNNEVNDVLTVKTEINQSEVKKRMLPYLLGAESKVENNERPEFFIKKIINYDVISFDIFDTLVIRPFTKPTDLFFILQQKFDYLNFSKIRIEMEKKAKDRAFFERGSREVNIYDIYEEINKYTGIDIEYGAETEFEVELDLCQANPFMLRVFKMCVELKKKIIITSDMYFDSYKLEKILTKCGYEAYDEIFVSCEHSCNKKNKGLFQLISSKYENKSIVHIGDNYKTDICNARECGWAAVLYKGVHDVGKKYRATFDGMSEVTGSTYGGIVDMHLLNGTRQFSELYEYGFIYGGIYVLGYCNWIKKFVDNNDIEKVLFISRDGAIYQKVYNLLFQERKTDYLYWSRIYCAKVTAQRDKYDFLLRIVKHRKNDVFPMTIREVFNMLEIDFAPIERDIRKYRIDWDDIIVEQNSDNVVNFMISKWDYIIEELDRLMPAAENYLKAIIGDSKRVAVVDIGWQGSGLFGIKWLVEEKMKLNCKVECLLAGSKALDVTGNLPEEMYGKYKAYLFSKTHNYDMFDYFTYSNKHTNTGHFELFTQAQAPTFAGINQNMQYVFGIPEVENLNKISEIHKGIIDYCILFKRIFSNYPWLMNISGYDALIPFRLITRNSLFIQKYLGDFVFSRNICANDNKPYLETIKDVLIKQGLYKD